MLIVFDVLQAGERDLRMLPLSERRDWLLEHIAPGNGVQIIEHIETHGEALFHVIVEHYQEGIVAKWLDAPYRAGRQPTWFKIKNANYSRREALVFHPRAA